MGFSKSFAGTFLIAIACKGKGDNCAILSLPSPVLWLVVKITLDRYHHVSINGNVRFRFEFYDVGGIDNADNLIKKEFWLHITFIMRSSDFTTFDMIILTTF